GLTADVCKRQHHHGKVGCRSQAWRNANTPCARSVPDDSIGTYRTGHVLKRLLTQIDEPEFELVPDLIVGGRRDADAAGFCNAFEPSGDVDAVAENIVTIDDDISDIDPDAKGNGLRCANAALRHLLLYRHRAGNCVYCARKFHQHAIAGGLDDAAA